MLGWSKLKRPEHRYLNGTLDIRLSENVSFLWRHLTKNRSDFLPDFIDIFQVYKSDWFIDIQE